MVLNLNLISQQCLTWHPISRTSSFPVTAAVLLNTALALFWEPGPEPGMSEAEYLLLSLDERWEKLPGDMVQVESISDLSSCDLCDPMGRSCRNNSRP